MTVILLLNISGQYSQSPIGRLLKKWGRVTGLGFLGGGQGNLRTTE